MASTYSLILRACPEGSREAVAALLGRAFSLKDSTCASIASSTPIILLADLNRDEAAAVSLATAPMEAKGAVIEFTTEDVAELPKIDWPRRPMVFKREITDHVADCAIVLPIPGTGRSMTLLDLLIARLEPQSVRSAPQAPATKPPAEFRGATMPEITPFSNQALPPVPQSAPAGPPAAAKSGETTDAVSRLNELFPEEEAGFMPNNNDITSILDRLLPDEDPGASAATPSGAHPIGSSSSSRQVVGAPPQGYAVFLAKITDDARRAKVVGILQELAKLSAADADALSKKVIIPVLKGVTKEEAEAAKQRFAKIGILARVKGPEGG